MITKGFTLYEEKYSRSWKGHENAAPVPPQPRTSSRTESRRLVRERSMGLLAHASPPPGGRLRHAARTRLGDGEIKVELVSHAHIRGMADTLWGTDRGRRGL